MSNSEYKDREWERVLAEAVDAERERCARIAESYGGSKFEYECVGREIARRIREATPDPAGTARRRG